MSTHLTKDQLRQRCIKQRSTLPAAFVDQASQQIISQITQLPLYQTAQHIAWYFPVRNEVNLSKLWHRALLNSKSCYFPAMLPDHTLSFLPFKANTPLITHRYGISEPAVPFDQACPLHQLDLIFLPMVAFDHTLMRLGMGQGYYDKTLAQPHQATLIGVAYDWQKSPLIAHEPWDVPLDYIVTEAKIYS